MLNLLLGNRLLAFILLTAAIGRNHEAAPSLTEHHLHATSRHRELLGAIAFAAWAWVLAAWFPAFQVLFRVPETTWTAFDSRFPLGWLLAGIFVLFLLDRLKGFTLDPAFAFWMLVAAIIADERLPIGPFSAGGIQKFQAAEGLLGLVFLLYPIVAFSGRMGPVGRCLGLGLATLAFGVLPAAMLFFGAEYGRRRGAGNEAGEPHATGSALSHPLPGPGAILAVSAVSGAVLVGSEEFGGIGRGPSTLAATAIFVILFLALSRRSTEVHA